MPDVLDEGAEQPVEVSVAGLSQGEGGARVVSSLSSLAAVALVGGAAWVNGSVLLWAATALLAATAAGQVTSLLAGRRERRALRRSAPRHPGALGRGELLWGWLTALAVGLAGAVALGTAVVYGAADTAALADGEALVVVTVAVPVALAAKAATAAGSVWAVRQGVVGVAAPRVVAQLLRSSRADRALVAALDGAGAVALVLVATGMGLAMVTGSPGVEVAATVAVAVWALLAAAALLAQMRAMLVPEAGGRMREGVAAAVAVEPAVLRLVHMEAHALGAERELVALRVALIPGLTVAEVAEVVERLGRSVVQALPAAGVVFVEPTLALRGLEEDGSSARWGLGASVGTFASGGTYVLPASQLGPAQGTGSDADREADAEPEGAGAEGAGVGGEGPGGVGSREVVAGGSDDGS